MAVMWLTLETCRERIANAIERSNPLMTRVNKNGGSLPATHAFLKERREPCLVLLAR